METNRTLEIIRNEIERLKADYNARIPSSLMSESLVSLGKVEVLNELLSRLDTLESEKPMNLEEEINLWISENENIHHGDKLMVWLLKEVARYFAEWGVENLKK